MQLADEERGSTNDELNDQPEILGCGYQTTYGSGNPPLVQSVQATAGWKASSLFGVGSALNS